jgi:hypothetical protein
LPSVFADGSVPDDSLTVDQLGSRIVALSGRLAAATSRWLLLVAEFDARSGYSKLGMASTALWLQYSCGIAHRTAYSQARAISRVATGTGEDDPATPRLVECLIETARYGTVAQLEVMVRGLRTVHDNNTMPKQREARERVSQSWTPDSQWALSARLDPERGAQVKATLAAIGQAEDLSATDALVRLAEIGLAALADGNTPRAVRGEEQAAIVVHLNAADVPQPDPAGDEPGAQEDQAETAWPRSRERGTGPRPFGRIENGPGLPAGVVERLACAGRVRLVVRQGDKPHSDVLDLGRSHRFVTDRQCQALKIRDGGTCGYPGCPRTHRLEAHHVRHWLHGGSTDLDNLILVCKAHHLAHHDGEFTVIPLGKGKFRFVRDGRELPLAIDASSLARDPWAIEAEHTDVKANAATPLWDGSRMQRAYAVDAVAQHLSALKTA